LIIHHSNENPSVFAVAAVRFFIFLSAKSKPADVRRGYQAGADLYTPKPFSTRDLVGRVRELVSPVAG
jgi:DNA-binding response OmpR family regulator